MYRCTVNFGQNRILKWRHELNRHIVAFTNLALQFINGMGEYGDVMPMPDLSVANE